MRAIRKCGDGNFHLRNAHARPPTAPEQATSRWGGLSHKAELMQYLLDEQYHLCCYSELRADQERLGYHIEHIENKSQNPARTFDYGNLAACALESTNDLSIFKARGEEVFGGHFVGKNGAHGPIDMARFISPHQPDCRKFYAYVSDGRVVPVDRLSTHESDRAKYTIDSLNLNSPYLVTLRRKWWDELDQLFQEHLTKGWSLPDLAAVDLVPMHGKLSRFFSLTRQFLGTVAERTLQLQAPALL